MKQKRRTFGLAVIAGVFLGVSAGCGGSGGGGTGASDGQTPAPGPSPAPAPAPAPDTFPFTGSFVVTDFDWFASPSHVATLQVDTVPVGLIRRGDGVNARLHSSGLLVYSRGCGDRERQIFTSDNGLNETAITPCSDDLENPGFSTSRFESSSLSADQTLVAVGTRYFFNSDWVNRTAVYRTADQSLVGLVDDAIAPVWMPDGRLLMGSATGFIVSDADTTNVQTIAPAITNAVDWPAISPDGNQVAFEYQQQIWSMNIDGSDPQPRVQLAGTPRYPTYSPTGGELAYHWRNFHARY